MGDRDREERVPNRRTRCASPGEREFGGWRRVGEGTEGDADALGIADGSGHERYAEAAAHQGDVYKRQSSISKKTDYLLAGDSPGSKLELSLIHI